MESAFCSDQIDAHRLLVQVSTGRCTDDYQDNQQIYRQGEDADFVFFVQAGSVRITAVSEHGLETSIGVARVGQFFGEACLYDVPVRVATATAVGDCRITSVAKAAMFSAICGQPKFARKFVEYLAVHNSWVQKELLDHLISPVEAYQDS